MLYSLNTTDSVLSVSKFQGGKSLAEIFHVNEDRLTLVRTNVPTPEVIRKSLIVLMARRSLLISKTFCNLG